MPKRIPVNAVQVVRDGKLIQAPLGVPFDFTAGELEDIKRLTPGAVRAPVNEGADEPVKVDTKAADTATAASASKTKANGATTGADAL